MLELSFVEEIYNKKELDPRMARAREMNRELVMHVDGEEELTDECLERVNEYENEGQHEARTKHRMVNKWVTSKLLAPAQNIFSAKGGSTNYKFTTNQEDSEQKLSKIFQNLPNGYSANSYMKDVWFKRYVTDPNGLIFVEVPQDGGDPYPAYKNIHKIRMYEQRGIFTDWIIFEPHDTKKIGKKIIMFFWAVDEKNYYLYSYQYKKGEDIKINPEKAIPHDFGKPPAVLCSDITDTYPVSGSMFSGYWKKSPIDCQLPLLKKILVSNSVLAIQEFQHCFMREYEFADPCEKCGGSGVIDSVVDGQRTEISCGCENGNYTRKDPTDKLILRMPEKDQPPIGDPAGYIYPPVEPWKMEVGIVDRYMELAMESQWMATFEKQDNATATGRFIDTQPVNNRLGVYTDSYDRIGSAMLFFIGVYHFPKTLESVSKRGGRRYLIETPDQVWDKYMKSKKDKAPVFVLDFQLSEYLESEYRENDQLLLYYSKLAMLEPFVHYSLDIVRNSEYISAGDKMKKEYFGEWAKTQPMATIVMEDYEKLDNKLLEFSKSKIKNEENGKKQDEAIERGA